MKLIKILCVHFIFLIEKALTQEWQPNPPNEYYVSSEKKSFDEARSSCNQCDAELVMIKTKEIQNFINDIIPEGDVQSAFCNIMDFKTVINP